MSLWEGIENVKELSDEELFRRLETFVENTKNRAGAMTAMAEAILRIRRKQFGKIKIRR